MNLGLFLRTAHAMAPSSRTAICGCSEIAGRICFQKSAMKSSTTVAFTSPALTISRMSSSSSAVGSTLMETAALPCCLNVAFNAVRLSNWMLFSRTATCLPERSSIVLRIDAPGPVTTISRTSVLAGTVKSTSLARSGVTVTFAATMSPLPSISA